MAVLTVNFPLRFWIELSATYQGTMHSCCYGRVNMIQIIDNPKLQGTVNISGVLGHSK